VGRPPSPRSGNAGNLTKERVPPPPPPPAGLGGLPEHNGGNPPSTSQGPLGLPRPPPPLCPTRSRKSPPSRAAPTRRTFMNGPPRGSPPPPPPLKWLKRKKRPRMGPLGPCESRLSPIGKFANGPPLGLPPGKRNLLEGPPASVVPRRIISRPRKGLSGPRAGPWANGPLQRAPAAYQTPEAVVAGWARWLVSDPTFGGPRAGRLRKGPAMPPPRPPPANRPPAPLESFRRSSCPPPPTFV